MFNRIIKYSIYLLVFLLPVFFLPLSFEAFEFNKQYLLFFLIFLGFLAWLAKMMIQDKEIRFRKTPLDLFVLGFLVVGILSAIFSVDKISSLLGFYGRFSNGLMGFLSLGVLYFLITNNVGKEGVIKNIDGVVKVFLGGVLAVIILSYLAMFGITTSLPDLPALIQQPFFNPASGSLQGLVVFLAVVTVFLVGRILVGEGRGGVLNWILILFSLGLLMIVDFSGAWIIILASLVLFLSFTLGKRIFRENVNRLLLLIFLILISIFFLYTDLTKNVLDSLPQEQILDQNTSWQVAARSLTYNIKTIFLGSGIGTFHYDFAKFKPLEFNQTRLWQIRFDRAGSHFAEILATRGGLGMASYLALLGMFGLMGWFWLANLGKVKRNLGEIKEEARWFLPLLMVFSALIVGQLIYYQNTVLGFTFWLCLGLGMVSWQKSIKEKVLPFRDFPELSLVFRVILIILGLGIVLSFFFLGKFYAADVAYNQGKIEKAVKLNPYRVQYQIILARGYHNQILTESDSAKLQPVVTKAIDTAKNATELSPGRVTAWESLGMIYRDIQPLAQGATEWGIKAFQKAIELEPTNPVLHTELGKLYSNQGELQKAKQSFQKAESLKPNYVDTLFWLGILYFNNDQLDEAIVQFKKVISLMPNHSNARYSLGVAYQRKGNTDLAIKQFEKVLELNPGNQDVQQKLEQLRK